MTNQFTDTYKKLPTSKLHIGLIYFIRKPNIKILFPLKQQNLLLFILVTFLNSSCVQENKSDLNCSSFGYRDGILIKSDNKINSPATLIKYKKGSLNRAIDTLRLTVGICSLQMGDVYCIETSSDT